MIKNNTKHATVLGIAAVVKKSTHTHRIATFKRWYGWKKWGVLIAMFFAINVQNASSTIITGNLTVDQIKLLVLPATSCDLLEVPVNQDCHISVGAFPNNSTTLNFTKNKGYIKINKGARLYINGVILTSQNGNADNMWYGVYVDGTSGAVQNTNLVNTNTQGYFYMISSEIRHVKRGSSSTVTPSTICKGAITVNSGGIIRIYQSILDNNEVGIHFEPYPNSNISYIHFITFQNPTSFATDPHFSPAYKYTDIYIEIDQCIAIYI